MGEWVDSETFVVALTIAAACYVWIDLARFPEKWAERGRTIARYAFFFAIILLGLGAIARFHTERVEAKRQHQEDVATLAALRAEMHSVDEMVARMQRPLRRPKPGLEARLAEVYLVNGLLSLKSQPKSRPRRPVVIRPDWAPMSEQKDVLFGLIVQTPEARKGVWLSDIVLGLESGRYVGLPLPDTIDYPDAAEALAKDGKIEVLNRSKSPYFQADGHIEFSNDIQLRILTGRKV